MREPRAGVTLAQAGIELGAAGDDERVHQRRARAEQPAAALGDTVAEGTASTRYGVELAHAARDEDAAAGPAEKTPRDDPGGAAVGGMSFGPPDRQRAAAGSSVDARLNDAA